MLFRKTYIEITNICNAQCGFCPGTSRPPQFMERDLFALILAQIAPYSKRLHFHVLGEPLLHPELGFFLDRCHDFKCEVNLVTNGRRLKETMEALYNKPALRQLSVSLQSVSESPEIEHVEDYIDTIIEVSKRFQIFPHFNMSLRLWDSDVIPPPLLRAQILHLIEDRFTLSCNLADALKTKTSLPLAPQVFLNSLPSFEWPGMEKTNYGERGYCLGLTDQFAILVDGSVVPCCLDSDGSITLGNIRNTPLSEILTSTRATAMRTAFERGSVVEPLCQKCGFRRRFNSKLNIIDQKASRGL